MLSKRHLVIALTLLAGCETREPSTEAETRPPAPVVTETPPSPWRSVGGSKQVALPADEIGPALADAIATARRTADDARKRWSETPPDDRASWAIKWRATTGDGGHEFVWVEPIAWSGFRIEGRLASPPQRPLACGRGRDELVSFPADELADWVRYARADFSGKHEGGFTMEALEQSFGPP